MREVDINFELQYCIVCVKLALFRFVTFCVYNDSFAHARLNWGGVDARKLYILEYDLLAIRLASI